MLVALGLIAVLTIVVITAFKGGGNDKTPPVAKTSGSHASPPAPLLEVTALRGSTHLTVHTTSASGSIKFDGTVQQGDPPKGIRGSKLWVAISTPENVRIRVRGTLVHVPGRQPRVIIVTPTGWRPA